MELRLTEQQFQSILEKVEREWPIRLKLAELAGFESIHPKTGKPQKINPKNGSVLQGSPFDDLSIRELYLEVLFRKPENAEQALKLIQEFYK